MVLRWGCSDRYSRSQAWSCLVLGAALMAAPRIVRGGGLFIEGKKIKGRGTSKLNGFTDISPSVTAKVQLIQ